MFNLIKDEFDENTEDILTSINKMLEKNKKENEAEKEDKTEQNKEKNNN